MDDASGGKSHPLRVTLSEVLKEMFSRGILGCNLLLFGCEYLKISEYVLRWWGVEFEQCPGLDRLSPAKQGKNLRQ